MSFITLVASQQGGRNVGAAINLRVLSLFSRIVDGTASYRRFVPTLIATPPKLGEDGSGGIYM